MKKEKSEEKSKRRRGSTKVNIEEEIKKMIDSSDLIDDSSEDAIKLVSDRIDMTDTTGRLRSVNYTSLQDGIYYGAMNHGEGLVTLMKSNRKDPYFFDFGWSEGFKTHRRMTFKIIVKGHRGYIHCHNLATIHDHLKSAVESKEKELEYPRTGLSIEGLKEKLVLEKKSLEYLTGQREKLTKEVQESIKAAKKQRKDVKKLIETRKEALDELTLKHYGTLEPSGDMRKEKPATEEMKAAQKLLSKTRKLEVPVNYKVFKYECILDILTGVDKKVMRGDDSDD